MQNVLIVFGHRFPHSLVWYWRTEKTCRVKTFIQCLCRTSLLRSTGTCKIIGRCELHMLWVFKSCYYCFNGCHSSPPHLPAIAEESSHTYTIQLHIHILIKIFLLLSICAPSFPLIFICISCVFRWFSWCVPLHLFTSSTWTWNIPFLSWNGLFPTFVTLTMI